MKKIINYIFLCAGLGVFAQTTNTGMLYIAPDTRFATVEELDNRETAELYNQGEAFIYSHFNNDGIINFYEENGMTRFVGQDDQIISGTQTSFLFDVHFENTSDPSPFLLTGLVDISGVASFTEGIVDNRNFGGTIRFSEHAGHINTSDYSHVNGPVFKYGKQSFIFPVGHGGYYRFAGISAPENADSDFQTTYFLENSDNRYSHDLKAGIIKEINTREYWTVTEADSGHQEVLLTLSWNDNTTPAEMIDAAYEDELTIVRWDEDAGMWVDEGGSVDTAGQTITTAVSTRGVFTFGILKSDKLQPGGLTVYTGVTPNGDGINDHFIIDYPNDGSVRNLHVRVFNRWGVKVFESDNYGINGDVFDGFSQGRLTVNKDRKQLPSGTYYYILNYEYGEPSENNHHKQAGFLYLSGN